MVLDQNKSQAWRTAVPNSVKSYAILVSLSYCLYLFVHDLKDLSRDLFDFKGRVGGREGKGEHEKPNYCCFRILL